MNKKRYSEEQTIGMQRSCKGRFSCVSADGTVIKWEKILPKKQITVNLCHHVGKDADVP